MEPVPPAEASFANIADLLKKVEDCSVAEMIALPIAQRERMRRANLHIVDSPKRKEDEPKG